MTRSMTAIARGVLLGTLIADTLGAPFEGAAAVELGQARRRLEEVLEQRTLPYTDDTQLTLALAEHLCAHPEVDEHALAACFLDHFEEHRGYARGMFGVVDAWRAGIALAEAANAVFPDGSYGNGAAMRGAPVGVVWCRDDAALEAAARRQAALTHTHPIGLDGATVQARAVAVAARTGRFDVDAIAALSQSARTPEMQQALRTAEASARGYLRSAIPLPDVAEDVGTSVLADQSVPAALWVAAVAGDFTDVVVLSLGLGGDVDTVGAMAGAIVGAASTDSAIPQTWLDRAENGRRGVDYARQLAEDLAQVTERQAERT